MTPLKLTIAAVSAGYDDGKQVGVATLTCDLDTIRAVGGMLLREVVVQLADDPDPYRAFAVRVGLMFAASDEDNLLVRQIGVGDLDQLAEHIAARLERLQRLTAWTSLPEIPDHYETVEVKLCDDSHAFAWRDDDGGWHAEGRIGITDSDVVGWRSVIP